MRCLLLQGALTLGAPRQALHLVGTSEVRRKNTKRDVISIAAALVRDGSDLFSSLLPYLHTLLLSTEHSEQLAMLDLLQRLLKTLSGEQVMQFLDPALPFGLPTVFGAHPDSKCRSAYYQILMWLWDNHMDFASESSWRDLVRRNLLQGLSDDNSLLRQELYKFWDSDSR